LTSDPLTSKQHYQLRMPYRTSCYATWFTAGVQSASLIMTSLMTS